ncbi:hypothetical protein [Streptomyces sp. NPDC086519]|uniref:hypothetical protein n=1 Tax=Streptomyces sp. NPDC086519 TaxID=3154863 RepID=UPI00343AAC5B
MGWISSKQQERDHNGQRNICSADGHPSTDEDPLVTNLDGFRIHRSHTTDPTSGFYGQQQN